MIFFFSLFSVKFQWSPGILREGPEYVSSTRSPSALFARSRLVLRAPFALGEILNGFSAAQKRIEMVQKLLLLPFCRFVLYFFRDILFALQQEKWGITISCLNIQNISKGIVNDFHVILIVYSKAKISHHSIKLIIAEPIIDLAMTLFDNKSSLQDLSINFTKAVSNFVNSFASIWISLQNFIAKFPD